MLTALPSPQLLEISGADARSFAQAQFSSDVSKLETGCWQWSAWLNAQARVRGFFHLLRIADDKLWLLLRGGDAQRLRDALARYVLRAKVALRVVEGMQGFVAHDQTEVLDTPLAPGNEMITIGGGRLCLALPGSPQRWLLLTPSTQTFTTDGSDAARNRHALADIDAGLITLDPALEERLLPQWLGLDAVGATSVSKGCYPGQEVVARLHFKGGNKRSLYRIGYRDTTLSQPGAAIGTGVATADESGVIIAAAWREAEAVAALAVLNDEAAGASTLYVGTRPVEKIAPCR